MSDVKTYTVFMIFKPEMIINYDKINDDSNNVALST